MLTSRAGIAQSIGQRLPKKLPYGSRAECTRAFKKANLAMTVLFHPEEPKIFENLLASRSKIDQIIRMQRIFFAIVALNFLSVSMLEREAMGLWIRRLNEFAAPRFRDLRHKRVWAPITSRFPVRFVMSQQS
jgi:hypothetical protein